MESVQGHQSNNLGVVALPRSLFYLVQELLDCISDGIKRRKCFLIVPESIEDTARTRDGFFQQTQLSVSLWDPRGKERMDRRRASVLAACTNESKVRSTIRIVEESDTTNPFDGFDEKRVSFESFSCNVSPFSCWYETAKMFRGPEYIRISNDSKRDEVAILLRTSDTTCVPAMRWRGIHRAWQILYS